MSPLKKFLKLPANVKRLALAQPLLASTTSLNVFLGGIVGSHIAPTKELATAPSASLIVGIALSSYPVSVLMKKLGRPIATRSIIIFSILISALAAFSISISSFFLFCLSTFLFGVTAACALQARFAAIESVPPEDSGLAVSTIMVGGIFAAILGPEVGEIGKNFLQTPYAGSYLALSVLFAFSLVILWPLKNTQALEKISTEAARPVGVIAKNPVFWVAILNSAIGYAAMGFIMTATPVSMHVLNDHSLGHTKWVIQSHILAMYVPSLVSAILIKKIGLVKLMLFGSLAYLACIAIGFSGVDLHHFWLALVLLGIGWNFMFVGGTTLLPRSYLPSERFKIQGLNEVIVFGLNSVASLSAGWVVYTWGWRSVLFLALPLVGVQLFVTLRYYFSRS